MEKVYGPFYLEEHKYYIQINRDPASAFITVFEHQEGSAKIYHQCETQPRQMRQLIDLFEDRGGEEFINVFLTDKNTKKSSLASDWYLETLAP
jgi:hypothetical protein